MRRLLPVVLSGLWACQTDQTTVEVGPEPALQDGIPAATTPSPGGWQAEVQRGGRLTLVAPDGTERLVAERGVLHVLSFSADERQLAYGQESDEGGTDLFRLDLTDEDAEPVALTDWVGAEDRPLFSPEGTRLAFVSGRTGWASVWVLEVDEGGDSAIQLTNVGVEALPRVPGQPPPGFVPPPQADFAWTETGLSWSADGQGYSVVVP